jgi:hypothetical protein
MLKNVTANAVTHLQLLAVESQISPDQAYYLVDPKERGGGTLLWFITPSTTFDEKKYQLREVNGVRMAVENQSAFFLTKAVLDFDDELANDDTIYNPLPSPNDHFVWPKGFIFRNQTKVWD